MAQFDFNEKFRNRTEKLSLQVINWYGNLDPQDEETQLLGQQLIHSITATAVGFRAACRARSHAERLQKLGPVIEHSDQTLFWLDLFRQVKPGEHKTLDLIYAEALEILKVMSTHRRNLKTS